MLQHPQFSPMCNPITKIAYAATSMKICQKDTYVSVESRVYESYKWDFFYTSILEYQLLRKLIQLENGNM